MNKEKAEAEERRLREDLVSGNERADLAESRCTLLESEKSQIAADRAAIALQVRTALPNPLRILISRYQWVPNFW